MGNQGVAATLGPVAVIFLAGLICSAATIAGDNMQDLKCGHIVGVPLEAATISGDRRI